MSPLEPTQVNPDLVKAAHFNQSAENWLQRLSSIPKLEKVSDFEKEAKFCKTFQDKIVDLLKMPQDDPELAKLITTYTGTVTKITEKVQDLFKVRAVDVISFAGDFEKSLGEKQKVTSEQQQKYLKLFRDLDSEKPFIDQTADETLINQFQSTFQTIADHLVRLGNGAKHEREVNQELVNCGERIRITTDQREMAQRTLARFELELSAKPIFSDTAYIRSQIKDAKAKLDGINTRLGNLQNRQLDLRFEALKL